MNNFEFENVIKEESASENLRETLRETMFHIVLINTVKRGLHVTTDVLEAMQDAFMDFVYSDNVRIEKFSNNDKSGNALFEFGTEDDSKWIHQAILLCNYLNEENIFIEDFIGNGFCCRNGDNHFRITHEN